MNSDYKILYFDEINSTNSYLLENYNKYDDKTVAIAKKQTNGKGRMGRAWSSLDNKGLYMSILLKASDIHNKNLENYQPLTLVTGLAVLKAIKKNYNFSIDAKNHLGLKWVNDIVYNYKKLGGILVESKILNNSAIFVVGIGININQDEAFFKKNNLSNAISLKNITENNVDVLVFAKSIIDCFNFYYNKLIDFSFKSLQDEYNKNCVNIGKFVKATSDNQILEGKALYVNEYGNLVVEYENKKIAIKSNEVSIRGKNNLYY